MKTVFIIIISIIKVGSPEVHITVPTAYNSLKECQGAEHMILAQRNTGHTVRAKCHILYLPEKP